LININYQTINIPPDASKTEKEELGQKKQEINRKIVEILRPEILKLKDLMQFVNQTLAVLLDIVRALASSESREKMVPEGLNVAIIRLIDVLLKLDNLKDMKSCLNNDFTRYRRAVTTLVDQGGGGVSTVLIDEQQELQPFICSLDPKKTKMWIFQTLRPDLKRIVGHEEILVEIMEQAIYNLDNGIFTTPDERFRYMRVIPYLLMLIDGDIEDGAKSVNVFKSKLFKVPTVQKLFKEYPVIPLYADMTLTTYMILANSPHFDGNTMGSAWGAKPDASVVDRHQLSSHWQKIKDEYTHCLTSLTALLHALDAVPFQKVFTPQSIKVAREVFELIKKCFGTLAGWASNLSLCLAWKYTHPCSDEQLAERKGADTSLGGQYEKVLRYNFSDSELSVLVDVVSMIKSLSSLMNKSESVMAPIIRFHIHHVTQQLVQGDLQPVIHRADKRKNPMLPALLDIRALAADWLNGVEPRGDYKNYSRKQVDYYAML
jgi:cytoplasmic FMR1 interacting protein